jgi:hypothetical protein
MDNLNDLMSILRWNVDNDIGKQLKHAILCFNFHI